MTNYSFQSVGPIFMIAGSTTYNILNIGFTVIDMDVLDNEQLLLVKKGLQYNYLVSPNSVNVLAYIESNTVEQGNSSSEQIADSIGLIIAGQNGAQVTYDDNGNQIIIEVPALANKADTVHTHVIADVIGMQTALDGKEATNASNISSGTLANARLSANLTQIGNETFANGEIIQNFSGTLQNASLGVGVTGAIEITNSAGSILFDAPYSKGPLNQKSGFFEDFITYSAGTISPYLIRTVSGAGAATSIGAALSSGDTRNGYIVCTTGTTMVGLVGIASGGLSYINFANIPVGGYEEVGFRFTIPVISDATQSFQIVAGFGDSASGLTPTDGAYITVGSGTTGFQANTSSNSTRTNSGSLLATVANTDYVVRVRVSNIAGTLSTSQYVNGTQLGTAITTNIPSGAGRDLGIQFGIAKIAGLTARTVELDWIYHESFKPRTINY